MRKDAQAVLLLLIGGTLLKISITGTYVRYVRASQLPLLVIAGGLLVVLAGVTLWQVIRMPRPLRAAAEEQAPQPSGFEDLAAPAPVEKVTRAGAQPNAVVGGEPSTRVPHGPTATERADAGTTADKATTDMETAADGETPARVETAGVETAGVETAGVEAAGVEAAGDVKAPARVEAPGDVEVPAAAGTVVHVLEPVSLSALRDPDQPRSTPWRHPERGAREQETMLLPAVRQSSGQPVAAEVTYREFTPGELVAVPVGHHLVDRAAHERKRESQAAAAGPATAFVEGHDDRHDDHEHDDHEHDDHEYDGWGHSHGEPRVAWLLLLPALALLLFAPPALGSYQATRNGTALSSQANSDFPPLPEGDPVRISMLDYAGRAVFDQGRSLLGRQVTLSGFIIAGPDGQPYLARMVVTCCAADGRPVKVGLAGDLPTTLKPDEWIEVVGGYIDRSDKDPVNAELVPYIQVTSVRDIPAPQAQYES